MERQQITMNADELDKGTPVQHQTIRNNNDAIATVSLWTGNTIQN